MKIKRVKPAFHKDDEEATSKNPVVHFSYFKDGVIGATPGQYSHFRGRVLPAFDLSFDVVDESFKTSTDSYRMPDIDPASGNQLLSEFAMGVWVYCFFGNKKSRIVSPKSKAELGYEDLTKESLADPIQDVITTIKKADDNKYGYLLQKDSSGFAKISPRSLRAFFNMYGYIGGDKSTVNVSVVDVSTKAYKELERMLNIPSTLARDPNWTQYLLGDVTDKETGLICDIEPIWEVDDTGKNKYYNGFNFQPFLPPDYKGKKLKNLDGIREKGVSDDILAKRSILIGEDSVFKILPYSDIVEHILDDGAIPAILVKEACGHMCEFEIPEEKENTTYSIPESTREPEEVPMDVMKNIAYGTPLDKTKEDLTGEISRDVAYAPFGITDEDKVKESDVEEELTGAEHIPFDMDDNIVEELPVVEDEEPSPAEAPVVEEMDQDSIDWYYKNATPELMSKMNSDEVEKFTSIGIYLAEQKNE